METIRMFRGPYAFLSNMTSCRVTYGDFTFSSVEHAYIAEKCGITDRALLEKMDAQSPGTLKTSTRGYGDALFHQRKLQIMEGLVRIKFTENPGLKRMLLDTGDALLEEGGWWHDSFWGSGQCGKNCSRCKIGQNHLGKILMKVREELKETA